LHVSAAITHVPVVDPQSSAPQQSLLSPHASPVFAHPHLPFVQTSEQHASGSVQAVPSAAHTLSVHTEPTHWRLPQQSEATVHGCIAFAHPQVPVPGSHWRAPQQSDVAVQSSPSPAQAQAPVASQTSPPQHSPSAAQGCPTAAQAHAPAVHEPVQQSPFAMQGPARSLHAGPGSVKVSSAQVKLVSSQTRSPQQSSSLAQSLPVPAQAGVQTLALQNVEQHAPSLEQLTPSGAQAPAAAPPSTFPAASTGPPPPSPAPPSSEGPPPPPAPAPQAPKVHASEQHSA
jgi:hypothetical protein